MLERRTFRCMTTDILLLLDTEDSRSAQEAFDEVEAFFMATEARFSRFRPDSELSHLNQAAGQPVAVSPELAELVQLAVAAARASDGVFDPSIIDALEAAGYDRSIERVRTEGAHVRPAPPAHPRVWQRILVDQANLMVTLPAGNRIDLGGIGKGWAADRAVASLASLGPGIVDAGGDLRTWGDQPGADPGRGWLVAVDDAAQPGTDTAWIWVHDGAAATSSITKRRWASGHHLIDPRTGRPADTDLLAVTVLAPTTVQAETAAKVALILGREAGLTWLAGQPGVDALLAADGRFFGTEGIVGALA